MKYGNKILLSIAVAGLIFSGCGGGSDSENDTSTVAISGQVIDGYISNAKVCVDLNFNKRCDSNEPYGFTKSDGSFNLNANPDEENLSVAPLLVEPTFNSVDTATGELYETTLSAARDANKFNISPITTLAGEDIYSQAQNGVAQSDIEYANSQLKTALGLDENASLSDLDPTKDPKLLATAVVLNAAIKRGESLNIGSATDIKNVIPLDLQSVYDAVMNSLNNNISIDPALLQQAIEVSIENNDTSILNDLNNPDALSQSILSSYLNTVVNELNETEALTLNGISIDSFDPAAVAQALINDEGIKDIKALNESDNVEVNGTDITDLLKLKKAIEASIQALDKTGVSETYDFAKVYNSYTGDEISFNPSDYYEVKFKYNNNIQNMFVDYDEMVFYSNKKLYKITSTGVNIYPAVALNASTVNDDTNWSSVFTSDLDIGVYTESDLNSTAFQTDTGAIIYFKDGTFYLSSKDTGNISVNYDILSSGVVKIPGPDNGTVYMIKEGDSNAIFVFTDSNGYIKEIEERTLSVYTGDLPFDISSTDTSTDTSGTNTTDTSSTNAFTTELVSDKTYAFNDDFVVFKNDGTWVSYSSGVQDDSGTWTIDENDGNLVLNDGNNNIVFSLIENYGDAGIVLEVNTPFGETAMAVLNTTDPLNVNVDSSDDLKTISGIISSSQFTSDMIAGKSLYSERFHQNYTFDSNGSFTMTDGEGSETGTWEVDSNGVLVLNYDVGGEIDTLYTALGLVDGDNYKVVDFAVKDGKLVGASPDELTPTSYPLFLSLGQLWGYNWYKLAAFYPGDTRYEGNTVEINDDALKLVAYKKDGADSRAHVSTALNSAGYMAEVNLITDGEYSKFQTAGLTKNITTSSTLNGLSSDSNLTFFAGLTLRQNRISAWWEVDDQDGHSTDGDVASITYDYNLTDITSDGSDVRIEINSDNGIIEYKVYRKDNDEVIFDKNLSVSDLNITNFAQFDYVYLRSRVDATDTNDTLDESFNYVNSFGAISNIDGVDDFLNALDFTPVSLSSDDLSGKTIITDLFGNSGSIYFDSNGTFIHNGDDTGSWSVDSNVLVLDDGTPTYVAVKDKNTSIITVKGYDANDYEWFDDVAMIANITPDTTITSTDDVLNAISLTPLTITESDVAGTWKTLNSDMNDTQTYDDDGSFSASWDNEDGSTTTITGSWAIDNNVIVVTLDSNDFGWSKIYVVNIADNNGVVTQICVITDSDGKIKMVSGSYVQKQ